jgi:hypothetical protein
MRQRLFDSLGIGPRMIRAGGILITFHLVCLGWIFFRAQNISHAGQILRGLFRDVTSIAPILKPLGSSGFAIAVASIAVLLVVDLLQKHEGLKSSVEKTPYLLLRYPVYAMLLFGILLFGIFKEEPFLYFQF